MLFISIPIYPMHAPFNISLNIPFTHNFQAASNFLHKHGWPILVTGAAVATVLSYDKPLIWSLGNISIGSLLMYRIIQLQKQLDMFMQQQEARIQQNNQLTATVNTLKDEQGMQKELLAQINTLVAPLPQQIVEHGKLIEAKFVAFDAEHISGVRKDVARATDVLDKVNQSIGSHNEQLDALRLKINEGKALLESIKKRQEEVVAEHKQRFDAIENKVETGFNRVDIAMVASFNEIRDYLEKKGVAWQKNKQMSFGRAVGGLSPLGVSMKLSNDS